MPSEELKEMFDAFRRIREHRDAELRKLLEDPDRLEFATQLMDDLEGCLDYLHNFQSCVANNGKVVDKSEVYRRISDLMRDRFFALTGQRYVPEIVRQVERRRRGE